MINKTLSERLADIEQLNQDILRSNKGELNGEEVSGTFEMAIKIISKLQAENKSWQEMVDSVNQTNRAMGNMLNKFEAKVKELEGKVEVAVDYIDRSLPAIGKNGSIPRLAAENILKQIKGE